MKGVLLAAIVLAACCASAEADAESTFGETYVGVAGAVTLPQGGSRLHHVGGGLVRLGTYVRDELALEAEGAWLEDVCSIAAQGLVPFSACELYDRFFGYSRFDPFLTLGVRGWVGEACGQVGPKAGLGAFYHLTDNWSLRADADATLGLETNCEMLYTIGVGVQYSF